MREAAAEDSGHRLLDLFGCWLRSLVEEGFGGHDHTVHTEPALGCLLGDERFLQRVGFVNGSYSIERGYVRAFGGLQRGDARSHGLAFNNDAAGSALAEAAAKFGTSEFEVIAEDIEERRGGVCVDRVGAAVDLDGNGAHTVRL